MAANDLSKENIKDIVYSYTEPKITDELYSFGSFLLTDVRGRSGHIDSKAAMMFGWSTGILVFLFTELNRSRGYIELAFGVAAGACCLSAAVYAFFALRARSEWKWPSDRDWFEESALSSAEDLKRFHIRSIHEVRQAQRQVTDRKGDLLFRSQDFMVVGAVLFCARHFV